MYLGGCGRLTIPFSLKVLELSVCPSRTLPVPTARPASGKSGAARCPVSWGQSREGCGLLEVSSDAPIPASRGSLGMISQHLYLRYFRTCHSPIPSPTRVPILLVKNEQFREAEGLD